MIKLKRKLETVQQWLLDLIGLIDQIPAVIDLEHEAVKAHRLDLIHQTHQKKEDLKAALEQAVNKILCSQVLTSKEQPLTKLDQVYEILDAEFQRLPQENQRALRHVKENFDLTFNDLKSHFKEARISIDKNKIVLQRVLENHQKSFHFWADLAQESLSSYDAKGKKPTPPSVGQFEIKV